MWNTLANESVIQQTVEKLQENGIKAIIVKTKEEAKQKLVELIPSGSEVMTMTSVTLDQIGATDVLNDSTQYTSSRDTLYALDRNTQGKQMNILGAVSDWTVGSVHAVTEQGEVIIASNTGSQLSAYAYSSPHIIWVVGTQKIVKNIEEGMKRLHDYVLPLESERAKKAYGVDGSNISKLLIINKEINPERITIIFVEDIVGY